MILVFTDPDGDPGAVESDSIVGLSVFRHPEHASAVTLIHTEATADRPFMVVAPFADVLHRWTEARGESLAVKVSEAGHRHPYPNTIGWQHQYPGGAQ